MDKLVDKTFIISGMTIKVIAEQHERWETRNMTTGETIYFDKPVLENAIRLGKAEEVSQ